MIMMPLTPTWFSYFFFYFIFKKFWSHCKVWGARTVSYPQPGIEPPSPIVETESLNCWAAREVPHLVVLKFKDIVRTH